MGGSGGGSGEGDAGFHSGESLYFIQKVVGTLWRVINEWITSLDLRALISLSENGRERRTLKLFEPGAHHPSFVFLHTGLNAFVAFPFIPCPTGPISSQTQKCYFCNFLLIYTKFL